MMGEKTKRKPKGCSGLETSTEAECNDESQIPSSQPQTLPHKSTFCEEVSIRWLRRQRNIFLSCRAKLGRPCSCTATISAVLLAMASPLSSTRSSSSHFDDKSCRYKGGTRKRSTKASNSSSNTNTRKKLTNRLMGAQAQANSTKSTRRRL